MLQKSSELDGSLCALVNTVMNLRDPKTTGYLFIILATTRFSETLLHDVMWSACTA